MAEKSAGTANGAASVIESKQEVTVHAAARHLLSGCVRT